MNDWDARANELFLEALETPERLRAAFLDDACRGAPEVRNQVESLLAASLKSQKFMERPLVDTRIAVVSPPSPTEARLLGEKYRLGEKIGLGGMGVVYVAEQVQPIRRRVAVKLIRNIDDPKRLLTRFEQERQTLALMDHPNIAKVYDAGATPDEQPFLVMEFIAGAAVTTYCDERRLPQAARLELFVQICKGVQHAHQKGAIHRDLKPSNVLVTESDGRATPKIIDFGVAKVVGPKLGGPTFETDAGTLVGTLEYMAPEQLGAGADVDVRADVYSLGVILYELLTGSLPFDRERLRKSSLDEAVRLIRDSDPPMMSTRLRTVETLVEAAAARGVEPRALAASLRGDLDWIVQRCLEKDPDRRYPSALDLARDLERHLGHEPVEARPASAAYRLRKYVRRHRVFVTAAAAVALALVVGVVGTTLGMLEARRSQAAEAAARARAESTRDRALAAMDAMTSHAGGDALSTQPALSREQTEFLSQALGHYRAFADETPDDEAGRKRVALAAVRVGVIECNLGRMAECVATYRRAIELLAALAAERPDDGFYRLQLAATRIAISGTLLKLGRTDESERELLTAENEMLDLVERHPENSDYDLQLAKVRRVLGDQCLYVGDLRQAETKLLDAVARFEGAPADARADNFARRELASAYRTLGVLRWRQRDRRAALALCRKELPLREALAAAGSQPQFDRNELAICKSNMAHSMIDDGAYVEGEKMVRQVLAEYEELIRAYPGVRGFRRGYAANWEHLGTSATNRKRTSEAGAAFRKAIAVIEKAQADFGAAPDLDHELARILCNYGRSQNIAGDYRGGVESLDKAAAIFERIRARDPKHAQNVQFLRNAYTNRALAHQELGANEKALHDVERAVEFSPPAERVTYRIYALYAKAKCGDVARTVAEVEELSKTAPPSAKNLATYAQTLGILAERTPEKRAELCDRTMVFLRLAVEKGYADANVLQNDRAFAVVRGRQDFADLLAGMATRTAPKKK